MIYKRGEKGIYWYRFRFGGRIIHESAKTQSKTVVKEAERTRRRELEESYNRIEKRELPPTFAKAAQDWQARREGRVALNTVRIGEQALKHVQPVFGPKLLCDIRTEDIQHYQSARRREGAQGRTINIETGTLRQVMGKFWPADVRRLKENEDVGRALSVEEEARLLAATAKLDSACHTAAVLALHTGMRAGEIRILHWFQIDFEKRTVTIGRNIGDSKTEAGRGRVIPINTDAFNALLKWSARFPDARPEHYVFPFARGGAIRRKRQESGELAAEVALHVDPSRPALGWKGVWYKAVEAAGVSCRFHDLRHTAATKMLEKGVPLAVVAQILGWSASTMARMAKRYGHIRPEALRIALESIATPEVQPIVHQIVNQIDGATGGYGSNLLQ